MVAYLWSVLVVACVTTAVRGEIVATETDFTVDCGIEPADGGGPISITYNNVGKTPVPAKMYSPNNLETCVVTSDQAAGGVYTISDVRTNCEITYPDPAKHEYFIQIALREISGIILDTDPVFNIECLYKAGEVIASSATVNVVESVIQTTVVVEATGNPDMTYSLNLQDASGVSITDASVGDQVVLQIQMSSTDDDEMSIQVTSCTAKSGTSSTTFLENSCWAAGMSSLSILPGFMTTGTKAFLPFTLFAVEGGVSSELEFECTVNVCGTNCDGQNCATTRRRRRAAGDGTGAPETGKSLTLARSIQLVPIGFSPVGQTGQNQSTSGSCFQTMGFIITVVVLGILLLVSMVIAIGLFTARRREFQKSNP